MNYLRSRLFSRFSSSEAGAAIVELAVVLPVLILLAIGAAEYGRVYYASIAVANAARAGAQYGAQSVATSSDTAGMNNAANVDGGDIGGVSPASSRFCRCLGDTAVGCASQCPSIGNPEVFVQTTATKQINFLLKYPGLGNSMTIRRTAVFRIQ